MRLHRLTITGVGPFRDRQVIDFDELSSSGLFLIDGPTGSGKTTIIDSIVYALYGVVSGSESDSSRMRSTYCGPNDPTGVACEFSVNGRRHLITRVPKDAPDPENPTKAPARATKQVLTEFAQDGSTLIILTRKREVDDHIETLVGMTADQCRQLVVLPQGQFADLLRKTPTERLDSLASLLDDGFLKLVQDDLRHQGETATAQRQQADTRVANAAQQCFGKLRAHIEGLSVAPEVDFTDPAIPDERRLASLHSLLDAVSTEAAEAAKQQESLATIVSTRREASISARHVAEVLGAVGAAQSHLRELQQSLPDEDRDVALADVPSRIGELRIFEGMLTAHAEWESLSAARAMDRAALIAQQEASAQRTGELLQQQDGLPARRADVEDRKRAGQLAAASLKVASQEVARLTALTAKARELSASESTLYEREQQAAAAETARIAANDVAEAARRDWEALVSRQRQERAADLASTLAKGGPCPVCGSTEHPTPAHLAEDSTLISDDDVEQAKRRADATRSRAADLVAGLREIHGLVALARSEVDSLRGALDGSGAVDIERALADAKALKSAAEQAASDLLAIDAELAAISDAGQTLAAQIADEQARAASVAATIAERDASEAKRREEIRLLIGEADSATALLQQTRDRIGILSQLQQAQAALTEALATVPEDLRGLSLSDARLKDTVAQDALTKALDEHAVAADRATTLATLAAEAKPLSEEFETALSKRKTVREQTKPAVNLANLVAANNSRRLPLTAYALQRRFASVLAAASVHLERMSSGKFTFELNEETSKGHSGLGILLIDAWTGHSQEPRSLSGGETFYASLALALGLADVVMGEVAGSALETLFVDEGFGSLDQGTLYQVLDQLDQLRSGRRAVGVISHVTEMKEIPDRLEVRRQADSTSTVSRPNATITP